MLRSIRPLYGIKLGASDGDFGQLKDFFFDDKCWAVRYLVADTDPWLPGHQVLLAPSALGRLDETGGVLRVKVTRNEIADNPAMEPHQPVARPFREEYYRYCGWPCYWQGGAWWGLRGLPILPLLAQPFPREQGVASADPLHRPDAHLRSTQAVTGYRLRASDGMFGHVLDFTIDDQNWAMNQVVVRTGPRHSGEEMVIPTNQVDRISYEESTVFVHLTPEAVEHRLAPPVH